ncbi:MAG TPA: arylsulfotransferase family protein [Gemmatimonadales bacterium]
MPLPRSGRNGGALLAALLAACGSENIVEPLEPTFYSSEAQPNPLNVLSAIVEVEAARFDSVAVRYWHGTEAPRRTPAFAFGSDSSLRVPVLGLTASSEYQIETILYADGKATPVDTTGFLSGPVPAWIPAIGVQGTDTTPGFLALSLPDGGVVVDNTGKVVWYRHMPGGNLNSFQAHANGTWTLLSEADLAQVHVLNVLGEDLGSLTCDGYKTRFHDLLIEANGNYWILCDDTRVMDLTSVGGVASANVTATVVQHRTPGGQTLFEWNAFDHFEITDLPAGDRAGNAVNFTHGNSISLDTDGNLLLSFRSLSEITKVDVETGDVLWRFGGLANEFTILNDPKGFFERQHGVRVAGPSEIQMLDNGSGAPSRLVRYLINPQLRTALLEMAFVDAPTTFTLVGGATAYYPNGHAVVSFGQAGRVVEVDAAGNRAWELTGIDGSYVFRAFRIADLYDPVPLGME